MKHFSIINPKLLKKGDFTDIATTEHVFNTYLLTIAFRPNEYCLLSTLQIRFADGEPWKVVASNEGSYNGEITIELGDFNPEKNLQLFWEINAPLTKISAIAIFIVNKQTGKAARVKPATGVITIEKGKDWTDENKNIPLNF